MNVDSIFNAIGAVSQKIALKDKANEKRKQIRNAESKTCGNCYHWMKTSCIPEKKHGVFKSINSLGCKDFYLCPSTENFIKKLKEELAEIESKNIII